jgi:hypothetical protein
MNQNKTTHYKITSLLILSFCFANTFGQSFNDEKTSMINYIKRMYNSSPFEGARFIEGNEGSYYIAAISLLNNTSSAEINNTLAVKKAQEAVKISFAEPCIKFEMLSILTDDTKKSTTYLFSCQLLSDFVKAAYKKQPFNGAKIIAAPKCNYFVSVIALDTHKYTSESLMDRVALIKAKQQANTLFNGSIISSDVIIKTDETSSITTSTETIREQSMGFVEGIETLLKYAENENKVYIFYRELIK